MAKTSGGLGKGINALFGDIPEVDEENAENSIQMIPIGSIDPNKNQPRKQFAPEALDQLAASIRSVGVIQPIILAMNRPMPASMLSLLSLTIIRRVSKLCRTQMTMDAMKMIVNALTRKSFAFSHMWMTTDLALGRR